jgi:hypothetical protein
MSMENRNQTRFSNASRRQFLRNGSLLGVAPLLGLSAASGQDGGKGEKEKTADELLTPETTKAIDRGLRYLAGRQVTLGSSRGAFGSGGYPGSVGICGLGGLAFMAAGSTPGIGKYGKHVADAADFLARNTQKSGYIARGTNAVGNMYGHGFAMLCLSQAYGMSGKRELGEKLKLAINCTIAAQNEQGGWRYRPVKSDADLSVTVCQVMALRGARDAGINVPDKVRDKTIEYVKKSQAGDGSFRYTLGGGHTTFPLTAAGLVSLFSAGIYEGEEIDRGLEYLKRHRNGLGNHYYFYGHYYAVQAMWHAGGKWWNEWYPYIRDVLVKKQSKNGSWSSSYGGEFATAMATIILQMPNDMLPIFAR